MRRAVSAGDWAEVHFREDAMDLETQAHLTQLRQALTWRIHDLEAELHAQGTNRAEEAPGGGVMDRKDEADAWLRADIAAQSEQLELVELRRCQAALHRLDLGVYGDCCDCHDPIALRRLLVQPEAERCAECQATYESHMRGDVSHGGA
jgi:RNA polymerase-binding transcription factor DksA